MIRTKSLTNNIYSEIRFEFANMYYLNTKLQYKVVLIKISFNNQVSILGKAKLGETTMLQSSFVIFTQACIFCTVKLSSKCSMITNCRKLLKRALFTDCRRALSTCIYNVSQQKWLQGQGKVWKSGGWGGIIDTRSFDGTGFVSNSAKIWRGNCQQLIPLPPAPYSAGPAYCSVGVEGSEP